MSFPYNSANSYVLLVIARPVCKSILLFHNIRL